MFKDANENQKKCLLLDMRNLQSPITNTEDKTKQLQNPPERLL
jgi:hypothetical protein